MRPDSGPKFRIAQVAPVAKPVLPGDGDSIEQLVRMLCEDLADRGHDVTLFATANSHCGVPVRAVHERGYDEDDDVWEWRFHESLHAAFAFEQSAEFDVVHAHNYEHAVPFFGLSAAPVVHTHHVEASPELVRAYARYPDAHVIVPSRCAARALGDRPNVSVIPHGIDVDAFPFGERPGGHLLFLGRLIADKGPREAVEVARAAGMPLLVAGADVEGIAASLTGDDVTYVGAVGARERDRLLADAAALVYPLRYPEPFGLVLVEAMACGTPVVATRLGAVPEIVEEGVTGYLGETPGELAALVPAAIALDRRRVRAAARARFGRAGMAAAHESLYRRAASPGGVHRAVEAERT